MPQRTASEVADLLEEIGRRAAFEGGNPYKAKAYRAGGRKFAPPGTPLAELIKEGTLQTIPGVGARNRQKDRGPVSCGHRCIA